MQIQFGTAQDLRGQRVNAAAVADQLNRGTAKLSRQDIQDRLDKLQAELGFSGAPRCASPCPPRARTCPS